MDKQDILRELLADPDVKNTLKKILLEDQPKKVGRPKNTVKKVVKKATKKPTKTTKVVKTKAKRVSRKTKEEDPYRKEFVDDLTEAVTEILSDGREVNLIELNKKIKPVKRKPREKRVIPKRTCVCGSSFEGLGYLCNRCLGQKSA